METACGWCDKAPIQRQFGDGTGVCQRCWRTVRRETIGFPPCPVCGHRYWLMALGSWGYRCLGCGSKFTEEAAYAAKAELDRAREAARVA